MEYSKYSDEELVEISKDNAEAFECLYRRYKSVVLSVSRRYFLNGGDSNDLFEEGMFGLFKAVMSFNGKVPFKAFARHCIKTSILSAIKKSNGDKQKALNNVVSFTAISDEDDEDKNVMISDTDGNPESNYIVKESLLETKDKLFSLLSKYEKEIIELYLEGNSYEEISQKTGKNVKSIDNAIQRIKKKIQTAKMPS